MPDLEQSFRLFNCALCSKQVILCRLCDRGNIYCSASCSRTQRCNSTRRAGRRYQQSFAGRRSHAARQHRYRQRVALANKKVTHQGSTPGTKCGSVKENTLDEPLAAAASKTDLRREWLPACLGCGRTFGCFTRYEFFRGGRKLRKLRRRHGNFPRDGDGDPPPLSR